MKRKILFTVVMTVIAAVVLAGCGGENAAKENEDGANLADRLAAAGTEEIAVYLQEGLEFEDVMQSLDSDIAMSLYNLTDEQVSDCHMIGSTGATAEEIAVFKIKEGQEEAVENACGERIEAQKAVFENYVPKEMEKLSKPVMVAEGDTMIVVVCNDAEKAAELIDDFGK